MYYAKSSFHDFSDPRSAVADTTKQNPQSLGRGAAGQIFLVPFLEY